LTTTVEPEKLLKFIDDKKATAENLIPKLKEKINNETQIFEFSVYQTWKGFKSLLNKILNENKPIMILGDTNQWYEKKLDLHYKQFTRQRERLDIPAKILKINNTNIEKNKNDKIKTLPNVIKNSSTIFIFGDYVATFIWSRPLNATLVKSKELSKSYEDYFNILWEQHE